MGTARTVQRPNTRIIESIRPSQRPSAVFAKVYWTALAGVPSVMCKALWASLPRAFLDLCCRPPLLRRPLHDVDLRSLFDEVQDGFPGHVKLRLGVLV